MTISAENIMQASFMSGEKAAEELTCPSDCAVGSPPDAQRKRGAMVGGMSAAFGRPRDTSDATRAAPLRGVSTNHTASSLVGRPALSHVSFHPGLDRASQHSSSPT